MIKALKVVLDIQELDMKLLRLGKLKRGHQHELDNLKGVQNDLKEQVHRKSEDVLQLKHQVRFAEKEIEEIKDKVKRYEKQQDSVKKVEEFNALAQEISQGEREKHQVEQRLADSSEKLQAEEEFLDKLKDSLKQAEAQGEIYRAEITEAVSRINEEGRAIQKEREALVKDAPQDILQVYERLLNHKRDRVLVPIENRTCSGCHILVTAQHENLVRKADRLVFCEHCSRIHYWQESEELEGSTLATKKRRRRSSASV